MDNDISNITLNDDMGNEATFEVITKFDIEGKEYVIVKPQESDDDTAIALRIEKDEDCEDTFYTVEDEDELEIVQEAYETLFSDNDLN